jgi:hypothetical protein
MSTLHIHEIGAPLSDGSRPEIAPAISARDSSASLNHRSIQSLAWMSSISRLICCCPI